MSNDQPVPGEQVEQRVRECAVGIDAVQEAERVGSWTVDVAHLFAATLLDPVARRLFLDTGGDLGAVQRRLGRPVRAGTRSNEGDLPRAAAMAFTVPAEEFLTRVVEHLGTDGELSWRISSGGWREPLVRSTLRRRLLHDLLTSRDAPDLPGLPTGPADSTGRVQQHLISQLLEPLHTPPSSAPITPSRFP